MGLNNTNVISYDFVQDSLILNKYKSECMVSTSTPDEINFDECVVNLIVDTLSKQLNTEVTTSLVFDSTDDVCLSFCCEGAFTVSVKYTDKTFYIPNYMFYLNYPSYERVLDCFKDASKELGFKEFIIG